MNQEEWGCILGISRPGVSDIESGRRNVTDKHIKLLCVEPIQGKYVNEEWLRTGQGEMFKELPEEDEEGVAVVGAKGCVHNVSSLRGQSYSKIFFATSCCPVFLLKKDAWGI